MQPQNVIVYFNNQPRRLIPIWLLPADRLRFAATQNLSPSQQTILEIIQDNEGYATLQNIQMNHALSATEAQRNLNLLEKLGLIKTMRVAVAPGEMGRVFFTQVYRALQASDDVREIDLAVLGEPQAE